MFFDDYQVMKGVYLLKEAGVNLNKVTLHATKETLDQISDDVLNAIKEEGIGIKVFEPDNKPIHFSLLQDK